MKIPDLIDKNKRPFPAHPRVECYFPAASMEQARQRLGRAIERGDGPGLLVGATGTGKSLLLQVLAEQFRTRFDVAVLSCIQLCTRRALLQAILFELGLPYRFHDEGVLRLTLLDHLLPNERCPNGILLLVDEAQSLPVRLLEEIRLITNLVRDGYPRARLVLAGSPHLEELLTAPEMESLQQRIATRCYLAPLGKSESQRYVRAHLGAVSTAAADVFDAEALAAVYLATDGVPRLINQLCDRALLIAANRKTQRVGQSAVQEAWADVQQLPTPWETEPASLSKFSDQKVVEFGPLSELSSEYEPVATEYEPASDDLDSEHAALESSLDGNAVEHSAQDACANSSAYDATISAAAGLEDSGLEDSGQKHSGHEDSGHEDSGHEDSGHEDEDSGRKDCGESSVSASRFTISPDQVDHDPAMQAGVGEEQLLTEEQSTLDDAADEFVPAAEDAVDPFQEAFDDEELVLDTFSSLGNAFRPQTPRVENRSDGSLSTLVQEVFDTRMELAAEMNAAGMTENELDDEQFPGYEAPAPLESVPLISLATDSVSKLVVEYDPVFPEEDIAVFEEIADNTSSVTVKYPSPEESCPLDVKVADLESPEGRAPQESHDASTEILVVEDLPCDEVADEAEVCRIEYGQLFAKLRDG